MTSKEAAEAMAEKVAEWPAKYNCDGIDLDLEDGAGNRYSSSINPKIVYGTRLWWPSGLRQRFLILVEVRLLGHRFESRLG